MVFDQLIGKYFKTKGYIVIFGAIGFIEFVAFFEFVELIALIETVGV